MKKFKIKVEDSFFWNEGFYSNSKAPRQQVKRHLADGITIIEDGKLNGWLPKRSVLNF